MGYSNNNSKISCDAISKTFIQKELRRSMCCIKSAWM